MKIDNLIRLIQESKKLTDEDKAKLIAFVEWIKKCITAIRAAIRRLILFLRQHQTFCIGAGITILLALLAALIPWIGQLVATLTLMIGIGWSLVADLKSQLDGLFQFVDMEKGSVEI